MKILFGWKEGGRSILVVSSSSCPPKKGKPGKRKGKADLSLLPLSTAPAPGENLSRLKKFSSSPLHSNSNYLLHTTLCLAPPLLLDANMLDANTSSGPDRERAGLEKETSEPPHGKLEKADPGPVSACTANIGDRLTVQGMTPTPFHGNMLTCYRAF
jgi:hypothetical protein